MSGCQERQRQFFLPLRRNFLVIEILSYQVLVIISHFNINKNAY